MNTAIIAYSHTGSAAALGRALSDALPAEFFLLEEKRKRPAKDFFVGGMQAAFQLGSALQALPDVGRADVIVLGMPVWAGSTPPAINTVLKKLDFQNKTVFAFVTKADPAPQAPQKLAERLKASIEHKGGALKGVFAMPVGEHPLSRDAAQAQAALWAEEIRTLLERR